MKLLLKLILERVHTVLLIQGRPPTRCVHVGGEQFRRRRWWPALAWMDDGSMGVGSVPDECSRWRMVTGSGHRQLPAGFKSLTCPADRRQRHWARSRGQCGERPRAGALSLTHAVAVAAAAAGRASAFRGRPAPPDVTLLFSFSFAFL